MKIDFDYFWDKSTSLLIELQEIASEKIAIADKYRSSFRSPLYVVTQQIFSILSKMNRETEMLTKRVELIQSLHGTEIYTIKLGEEYFDLVASVTENQTVRVVSVEYPECYCESDSVKEALKVAEAKLPQYCDPKLRYYK